MIRRARLTAFGVLAAVTALGAAGSKPAPPPARPSFRWPVPTGWRKETIPFPLDFAKDLPYSGVEEIRFAPGMFTPGERGYWSYAFVWWLNGHPRLGATDLQNALERYFAGLSTSVAKEKGFAIDPQRFVVSIQPLPGSPEKLGHPAHRFTGTVDSYDAFTTGKPIVLNLEVWVWDCKDSGKRAAMVLASPADTGDPVWNSLRDRRDEFVCHGGTRQ